MSDLSSAGRMVRRFRQRRTIRKIWAMSATAFMPPPPRAFASYGEGSLIVAPSRIEGAEFVSIGKRVKIHEHIWIIARQQPGLPPPRLVLEDDVLINRFVKIVCVGEVTLGRGCMVGDNSYISDTHYVVEDPDVPVLQQGLAPPRPVVIGPGSHIAYRCTIRPGVTLGERVHVGPGSVVSDDVPARSVVYGDPARVIRRYDPDRREWLYVRHRFGERADESDADTV